MVTLTIDNLNQNTNYEFKVKHQGDDKNNYQYCPHKKEATTEKEIVGPIIPPTTTTKEKSKEEKPKEQTPKEQTPKEEKEQTPPIQAGTTTPPPTTPQQSQQQPQEQTLTLIPQVLGLGALALASIPLIPLPLQTSIFTLFAIPFIKRKKQKFWGVVYDQHKKQPIKNTVVYLKETNSNETLETTVTDDTGRYGFLISKPNNYTIEIKKGKYKIDTSHEHDPIYGKT
jgi:hypothetical protein